ncbi:DUF6768 family protein [Breoghania sp. L-A4]|uniref:DUF6768 family protein n=1 Tax=Breoghania sp. L-A4 TaxID=2304600 RepID=UPI000E35EB3F|nr:DUF6768 family protein [Breoghania sp. L-A4]AXS39100.1 hypothetical protein D1F64_02280 [Breoghania sp. L-A4]
MDKIDKLIEEALKSEDRALLEDTKELGYFALGLNQFRGRLGWVTWVIMVVQGAMFLGGVWCAVRFFGATEVLPALKWGLSAAVLMLAATTLKLSLAPQMQADRILRELKRVELMLLNRG